MTALQKRILRYLYWKPIPAPMSCYGEERSIYWHKLEAKLRMPHGVYTFVRELEAMGFLDGDLEYFGRVRVDTVEKAIQLQKIVEEK
jgi:hypothetical protein